MLLWHQRSLSLLNRCFCCCSFDLSLKHFATPARPFVSPSLTIVPKSGGATGPANRYLSLPQWVEEEEKGEVLGRLLRCSLGPGNPVIRGATSVNTAPTTGRQGGCWSRHPIGRSASGKWRWCGLSVSDPLYHHHHHTHTHHQHTSNWSHYCYCPLLQDEGCGTPGSFQRGEGRVLDQSGPQTTAQRQHVGASSSSLQKLILVLIFSSMFHKS